MSQQLINRSADLKRLRDEGFGLEIRAGFLLVHDVPFVNSSRELKRGTLVVKLVLAGDVTARPDDHVAHFMGEYPCHQDGREIAQMKSDSTRREIAEGVSIDHSFSAKPHEPYPDYYEKVATYAAILEGPARVVDPSANARCFRIVEPAADDEETVFNYIDTASSRAEIDVVSKKLKLKRIAIIGLGGTGSYVLDQLAKTPVKEIHLFDGDLFLQHNAFRAPGAPSVEELRAQPRKSAYFMAMYSKMHRGVIDHEEYLDAENVAFLQQMDFVFLCLDAGPAKRLIIESLIKFGRPFVDVGMGVYLSEGSLGGIVRLTGSTELERDHLTERISLSAEEGPNEYSNNIQVADLNALNASLAVIWWKKQCGFYLDLEHEYHCTYTIDGNALCNQDLRA
jgi:ThiF family